MRPVFPRTIKDSDLEKVVYEDLRSKALKAGKCGPVLESLISRKKLERVRGAIDLCLKVGLQRKVVVPPRMRFLYAKKPRWRVGLKVIRG